MKKSITLLSIIILIICQTIPAFAFSRQTHIDSSVNYALTWSSNTTILRNPNYINFDSRGGDCASFVSQCFNQVMSENSKWKQGTLFLGILIGNTASWSNADALYDYLKTDLSSATSTAFRVSSEKITYGNNRPGNWANGKSNPVFYDWEGDGTYDHVSIATGYVTNTSGVITQVNISQHNTDRENVIWDLWSYMNPTQRLYVKYSSLNITSN